MTFDSTTGNPNDRRAIGSPPERREWTIRKGKGFDLISGPETGLEVVRVVEKIQADNDLIEALAQAEAARRELEAFKSDEAYIELEAERDAARREAEQLVWKMGEQMGKAEAERDAARGGLEELEAERDQANAALKDAYDFIRDEGRWDDFMATAFVSRDE